MIYIDTMDQQQLAWLLVAATLGIFVIVRFSFWAAIKLVNFFWPVEDGKTRAERELDARYALMYTADLEQNPWHEPVHYTDKNRYNLTIINPRERW